MFQAIYSFVIASATYGSNRFGAPQAVNFAVAGFMGVVVSFVVQDRIVFRKEG
jgi:putative flippase GtrA